MPSQIEAGDIVWLAKKGWEAFHGKGPFRVAKVGGFERGTVIVTEMDGSVPKGAVEISEEMTPGLYLGQENVRKDEFRSALEQAWRSEHAKV